MNAITFRCRDAGLDMPTADARAILQVAAIKLRQVGAQTGRLSTVALADALEELSAGEIDAACEEMAAAAALWRISK